MYVIYYMFGEWHKQREEEDRRSSICSVVGMICQIVCISDKIILNTEHFWRAHVCGVLCVCVCMIVCARLPLLRLECRCAHTHARAVVPHALYVHFVPV